MRHPTNPLIAFSLTAHLLMAGSVVAGHNHDEIRQLRGTGQILSLETIIDNHRQRHPGGQLLEAELEFEHGHIYELKFLGDDGVVRQFEYEAHTGVPWPLEHKDSRTQGSLAMRLLLAEDDALLSSRLRGELQRVGFAVDVADNGVDASHMGMSEPYDAVVLDIGLPGRSGLDVLRDWRATRSPVPVLILTARDAWHEKVAGFKAGADDYLSKPFHTAELIARLHALLRRGIARPPGPLQAAGLELDEETQTVRVTATQTTFELTHTEFRLLRYLMLHPGQVLSKTRLIEHVYDFETEHDSNVLEVYINRLRRKFGHDRIATRRGQGYVFGNSNV